MKALLVLVLAWAPASAEVLTLDVGGRERRALVREPETGQAPRPLVLFLHGGGGNPGQADKQYGMSELAEKEGFLAVYPAGSGRFKNMLTWNAGNCCGYAMNKGVDDVAFLEALIDRLVTEGRADPARVYMTGMSNGAKMTHRFACERAERVAAIAAVGGAMGVKECRPSRPVPVLLIHGLMDENVPYKGGVGAKAHKSEPRVDRPIEEGARIWREAGSEVELITHAGGHIWPGSKQPRYRGADRMLSEPKATTLVWEFFQKRSRP